MNQQTEHRSRLVVEPDLQTRFTVALILAVCLESLFIGWGMLRIVGIARQWQRETLLWDVGLTAAIVLLPLVLINYFLGLYLTHKIAGPLERIRQALQGIRTGDLNQVIQVRPQDLLKGFSQEFNDTISFLRMLVRRDQGFVRSALQVLTRLQERVEEIGKDSPPPGGERRKKLRRKVDLELDRMKRDFGKTLEETRARLILVNAHFKAGPEPGEPPAPIVDE